MVRVCCSFDGPRQPFRHFALHHILFIHRPQDSLCMSQYAESRTIGRWGNRCSRSEAMASESTPSNLYSSKTAAIVVSSNISRAVWPFDALLANNHRIPESLRAALALVDCHRYTTRWGPLPHLLWTAAPISNDPALHTFSTVLRLETLVPGAALPA
jgi:hypothetical protein